MRFDLSELVLHRRGRTVVTRFAAAIGAYALLDRLAYLITYHSCYGWPVNSAIWRLELFIGMALQFCLHRYPVALGAALLLTLGGYLVRSMASARLREGRADPLDEVRAWADRHPLLRKLPAAVPGAIFAVWARGGVLRFSDEWPKVFLFYPTTSAITCVVVAVGLALVTGRLVLLGGRALIAPTHRPAPPLPATGQVAFSAIAVTAPSRAVMAGIAGLVMVTVVAMFAVFVAPYEYGMYWCREPLQWAVAALAVATASLYVAFRRAASVSVGIDGIRARYGVGSRFVAYRDLDAVHASGADVKLTCGDSIKLRLRMHGADADQAGEVAARIRDTIVAAREVTAGGAEHVVRIEPAARVAMMAEGGVDYRSPAVSREQLWAVVEGAAADAETRTAAARALAVRLTDEDRPRLRGVATRVADPRLRVALDALADESETAQVDTHASRRAVTRA